MNSNRYSPEWLEHFQLGQEGTPHLYVERGGAAPFGRFTVFWYDGTARGCVFAWTVRGAERAGARAIRGSVARREKAVLADAWVVLYEPAGVSA